MKQLVQNLRDGKTIVLEVPIPTVRPGMVLVRTAVSLVSAGTERMLVEFAEKNLFGKAQSRPDLVRQMIDKARREGLLTTLDAAFNRLNHPMALGYSSAGTILEVGAGVTDFKVGDRVACAGGNYAVHAEYAVVPKLLLAKLPPEVDFESAAFTTLGAIALQGFRLAQPQINDRIAVIGLGLLGLLAASIARAAGCQVLGIDISPDRVTLAGQMGFKAVIRPDAEAAAAAFTSNKGFDTVLICADTKSDDPVNLAGFIARDRGSVVAVGAVGLNIQRKQYYDKELDFKISRSYGPGRYDTNYEEGGKDYPFGYVRWTEGRNLATIVDLLAQKKMDVSPIISHRFPIDRAPEAYELITGKRDEPFLGVLLTYPSSEAVPVDTRVSLQSQPGKLYQPSETSLSLGILGAGNYAGATFLPVVSKVGKIRLKGIASASGLNARHAADQYKFEYACSSDRDIISDPDINVVAILTRHNLHASQVLEALNQGKAVYCEKPLAINETELHEIEGKLLDSSIPLLMVGFNRRFAPLSVQLKEFLSNRTEPLVINYSINAGYLPLNHWLHDPLLGGGRIIGEGCHFIDYLTFLTGASPVSIKASSLPELGRYHQDNVVITMTYPDGSIGTMTYLANGDKSYPKEQVSVFSGGRVAFLNDFRYLELVKDGRRKMIRSLLRQDKGHQNSWQTFLNTLQHGGTPPIPYEQLIEVTRASFDAVRLLSEAYASKNTDLS